MTGIAELGLHLLRTTQAAALACLDWVGRGDRNAADGAAVAAMRAVFEDVPGHGTVVIGEGEKDDAPMLYHGESLGAGGAPAFDVAVDPLENTTACAARAEGAVAVVAAAPAGTLWSTPGWYMDKLVVGADAAGAVDLQRPIEDNLAALAEALGKKVRDLVVVVLDKPRHGELITRLRGAGASVALIANGDVLGALRVLLPDGDADLLAGVGGAPEGVITACAARLLGGDQQSALAPQSPLERERLAIAGQRPGAVLARDQLAGAADCCLAATGITSCALPRGPHAARGGWRTQSLLLTRLHPALVVDAYHR